MCLRGASAVQEMLDRLEESPVQVLAIWEPVIFTDIAPPTASALSLLHDRRARQMWDPGRLASRELHPMLAGMGHGAPGLPGEGAAPEPEIVWDFVGYYPAGIRWNDRVPSPAFSAFPVIDGTDALSRILREAIADVPAAPPPPPASPPAP